jgi:hypothetical protein
MPATAVARNRKPQVGSATPRIAPPLPARSRVDDMLEVARKIELNLYPWQVIDCRYLQASGPKTWLWHEVATIVARQNGKTTNLELLALTRMVKYGHRVAHSAQNLKLPRESHEVLAGLVSTYYPKLLPKRGIRYAQGQESIHLTNGGYYHITSATKSGARGPSNDLVLIDETREFDDWAFISAIKPTIIARAEGQIAYFSNAGTPDSIVLNSLRARADNDHSLAYLEWSAAPELAPDDLKGWLRANPSIGHNPPLLENLEREYQANLLGNSMELWETEYLCRWSHQTGRTPLLETGEWERQDFGLTDAPRRATMGIKVDPSGERASAVMAWPHADGVALEVVADVTGNPIDTARLGPDLAALGVKLKARRVAFDPTTDADLIRYFRIIEPLASRAYAAATGTFVENALAKKFAVRDPAGILARDLNNTVRVTNSNGTYLAVKSSPETTNTAVEAAIRAAWFASAPQPKVMVY